jgi:prolyl-tRNA synthetase
MSERLVGTIVALHGDDKGLILPPEIAPFQAVIIPIPTKESRDEIYEACKKLKSELKEGGFRVHLDMRELRPGNKFYDWELKGVPVRLELGMRDIEKGVVTLVRRDSGEKSEVGRADLGAELRNALKDIAQNLYETAKKDLNENITSVNSLEEVRKVKGLAKANWCGEEDCGLEIEELTEMSVLGMLAAGESSEGNCIKCGKPTNTVIYLGISY